jgi:hypothetical protein
MVLALVMAMAAGPAFGIPADLRKVDCDASAGGQVGPLAVEDVGNGRVAVVFIAGDLAQSSTLKALAAEIRSRYRTMVFTLDDNTLACCGGMSGTAAALARLLSDSGIDRTCVVAGGDAARIVREVALTLPALRGAVFFGQPGIVPVMPVPVVVVASSVRSVDVIEQVDQLLGSGEAYDSHAQKPSRLYQGAAIP